MKKAIVSLLTAIVFCLSCSDKQEDRHWVQHFIPTYLTGTYYLTALSDNQRIALSICDVRYISSPDKYPGIRAERYLEIAERNGDMSYNRFADYDWAFRSAYADNFASLHLTSDKDWDEAHPAGTPLDDLIWVKAGCYGPYIQRGYTGEGIHFIDKRLDRIATDEFCVVTDLGVYRNPDFCFLSVPDKDELHTLTLTITTTDGTIHTPTITIRPREYSLIE